MQAEFNRKRHVKNLPDAYRKTTPDSNNYKILEIERAECDILRETIQAIDAILDLDNATGKTLDLYGERVGQARGVADDAKYLLMIKAKILRNLTDGSHVSLIDVLCQMFSCEPSEIHIVDDDGPCTVKIVNMPIGVIVRAGFTASQTLSIIKSLLPVCVTITSFMFEGTFEFSDSENDYDENKGFTDVEGGTIGGYFGIISGDENDDILPI